MIDAMKDELNGDDDEEQYDQDAKLSHRYMYSTQM